MFMIKYPNGMKKQTSDASPVLTRYGGRGASLEDDLNRSNEYYRECDIALIYKKPTPIQVVRVDYPNRAHAKIIEAYYRTPSTTDYNGIYQSISRPRKRSIRRCSHSNIFTPIRSSICAK